MRKSVRLFFVFSTLFAGFVVGIIALNRQEMVGDIRSRAATQSCFDDCRKTKGTKTCTALCGGTSGAAATAQPTPKQDACFTACRKEKGSKVCDQKCGTVGGVKPAAPDVEPGAPLAAGQCLFYDCSNMLVYDASGHRHLETGCCGSSCGPKCGKTEDVVPTTAPAAGQPASNLSCADVCASDPTDESCRACKKISPPSITLVTPAPITVSGGATCPGGLIKDKTTGTMRPPQAGDLVIGAGNHVFRCGTDGRYTDVSSQGYTFDDLTSVPPGITRDSKTAQGTFKAAPPPGAPGNIAHPAAPTGIAGTPAGTPTGVQTNIDRAFAAYLAAHPGVAQATALADFQKQEQAAWGEMIPKLVNLGLIKNPNDPNDPYMKKIASGELVGTEIQATYNAQKHGFAGVVMWFNEVTQGATKQGNDILMSNYTDCTGPTIWNCKNSSTHNYYDVLRGGLIQGAAPATAAVLVAALPAALVITAPATLATAITVGSTAFGIGATTQSLQNTAQACAANTIVTKQCGTAAAWTLFSGATTGLGVLSGTGRLAQAAAAAAPELNALKAGSELGFEGAKLGQVIDDAARLKQAADVAQYANQAARLATVEKVAGIAGTALFGSQAIDACKKGLSLECGVNAGAAVFSGFRTFAAFTGLAQTSETAAKTLQAAGKVESIGVGGGFAALSCGSALTTHDYIGCTQALGFAAVGVGGVLEHAPTGGETPREIAEASPIALFETAKIEQASLYDAQGKRLSGITDAQATAADVTLRLAAQQKASYEAAVEVATQKVTGIPETAGVKDLYARQADYQAALDLYNRRAANLPVADRLSDPDFIRLEQAKNVLVTSYATVDAEKHALGNPRNFFEKIVDTFTKPVEVATLQQAQQELLAEGNRVDVTTPEGKQVYQTYLDRALAARAAVEDLRLTPAQKSFAIEINQNNQERQRLQSELDPIDGKIAYADHQDTLSRDLGKAQSDLAAARGDRAAIGESQVHWDGTKWVGSDGKPVEQLFVGLSFDATTGKWNGPQGQVVETDVVSAEQNRLLVERRSALDSRIDVLNRNISDLLQIKSLSDAEISGLKVKRDGLAAKITKIDQELTRLSGEYKTAGTILARIKSIVLKPGQKHVAEASGLDVVRGNPKAEEILGLQKATPEFRAKIEGATRKLAPVITDAEHTVTTADQAKAKVDVLTAEIEGLKADRVKAQEALVVAVKNVTATSDPTTVTIARDAADALRTTEIKLYTAEKQARVLTRMETLLPLVDSNPAAKSELESLQKLQDVSIHTADDHVNIILEHTLRQQEANVNAVRGSNVPQVFSFRDEQVQLVARGLARGFDLTVLTTSGGKTSAVGPFLKQAGDALYDRTGLYITKEGLADAAYNTMRANLGDSVFLLKQGSDYRTLLDEYTSKNKKYIVTDGGGLAYLRNETLRPDLSPESRAAAVKLYDIAIKQVQSFMDEAPTLLDTGITYVSPYGEAIIRGSAEQKVGVLTFGSLLRDNRIVLNGKINETMMTSDGKLMFEKIPGGGVKWTEAGIRSVYQTLADRGVFDEGGRVDLAKRAAAVDLAVKIGFVEEGKTVDIPTETSDFVKNKISLYNDIANKFNSLMDLKRGTNAFISDAGVAMLGQKGTEQPAQRDSNIVTALAREYLTTALFDKTPNLDSVFVNGQSIKSTMFDVLRDIRSGGGAMFASTGTLGTSKAVAEMMFDTVQDDPAATRRYFGSSENGVFTAPTWSDTGGDPRFSEKDIHAVSTHTDALDAIVAAKQSGELDTGYKNAPNTRDIHEISIGVSGLPIEDVAAYLHKADGYGKAYAYFARYPDGSFYEVSFDANGNTVRGENADARVLEVNHAEVVPGAGIPDHSVIINNEGGIEGVDVKMGSGQSFSAITDADRPMADVVQQISRANRVESQPQKIRMFVVATDAVTLDKIPTTFEGLHTLFTANDEKINITNRTAGTGIALDTVATAAMTDMLRALESSGQEVKAAVVRKALAAVQNADVNAQQLSFIRGEEDYLTVRKNQITAAKNQHTELLDPTKNPEFSQIVSDFEVSTDPALKAIANDIRLNASADPNHFVFAESVIGPQQHIISELPQQRNLEAYMNMHAATVHEGDVLATLPKGGNAPVEVVRSLSVAREAEIQKSAAYAKSFTDGIKYQIAQALPWYKYNPTVTPTLSDDEKTAKIAADAAAIANARIAQALTVIQKPFDQLSIADRQTLLAGFVASRAMPAVSAAADSFIVSLPGGQELSVPNGANVTLNVNNPDGSNIAFVLVDQATAVTVGTAVKELQGKVGDKMKNTPQVTSGVIEILAGEQVATHQQSSPINPTAFAAGDQAIGVHLPQTARDQIRDRYRYDITYRISKETNTKVEDTAIDAVVAYETALATNSDVAAKKQAVEAALGEDVVTKVSGALANAYAAQVRAALPPTRPENFRILNINQLIAGLRFFGPSQSFFNAVANRGREVTNYFQVMGQRFAALFYRGTPVSVKPNLVPQQTLMDRLRNLWNRLPLSNQINPVSSTTTPDQVIAEAMTAVGNMNTNKIISAGGRLALLSGLAMMSNNPDFEDDPRLEKIATALQQDVANRLQEQFSDIPLTPEESEEAVMAIYSREVLLALDPSDPRTAQTTKAVEAIEVLLNKHPVAGKTAQQILDTVSKNFIDTWRSQSKIALSPALSTKSVREFFASLGAKIGNFAKNVKPFMKLDDTQMRETKQWERWRTDRLWIVGQVYNGTPRNNFIGWLVGRAIVPHLFIWDAIRIVTTPGGFWMYVGKHPTATPAAPVTPFTHPALAGAQILATLAQLTIAPVSSGYTMDTLPGGKLQSGDTVNGIPIGDINSWEIYVYAANGAFTNKKASDFFLTTRASGDRLLLGPKNSLTSGKSFNEALKISGIINLSGATITRGPGAPANGKTLADASIQHTQDVRLRVAAVFGGLVDTAELDRNPGADMLMTIKNYELTQMGLADGMDTVTATQAQEAIQAFLDNHNRSADIHTEKNIAMSPSDVLDAVSGQVLLVAKSLIPAAVVAPPAPAESAAAVPLEDLKIASVLDPKYEAILTQIPTDNTPVSFRRQARLAAYMLQSLDTGAPLITKDGRNLQSELDRFANEISNSGFASPRPTAPLKVIDPAKRFPAWLLARRIGSAVTKEEADAIDTYTSEYFNTYGKLNSEGFNGSIYVFGKDHGAKSLEKPFPYHLKLYIDGPAARNKDGVLMFFNLLANAGIHPDKAKLFFRSQITMYWDGGLSSDEINKVEAFAKQAGIAIRGPAQDVVNVQIPIKENNNSQYSFSMSNDASLGGFSYENNSYWKGKTYDPGEFFRQWLSTMFQGQKNPSHPYMLAFIRGDVKDGMSVDDFIKAVGPVDVAGLPTVYVSDQNKLNLFNSIPAIARVLRVVEPTPPAAPAPAAKKREGGFIGLGFLTMATQLAVADIQKAMTWVTDLYTRPGSERGALTIPGLSKSAAIISALEKIKGNPSKGIVRPESTNEFITVYRGQAGFDPRVPVAASAFRDETTNDVAKETTAAIIAKEINIPALVEIHAHRNDSQVLRKSKLNKEDVPDPILSWTKNEAKAREFSANGVVLTARIPKSALIDVNATITRSGYPALDITANEKSEGELATLGAVDPTWITKVSSLNPIDTKWDNALTTTAPLYALDEIETRSQLGKLIDAFNTDGSQRPGFFEEQPINEAYDGKPVTTMPQVTKYKQVMERYMAFEKIRSAKSIDEIITILQGLQELGHTTLGGVVNGQIQPVAIADIKTQIEQFVASSPGKGAKIDIQHPRIRDIVYTILLHTQVPATFDSAAFTKDLAALQNDIAAKKFEPADVVANQLRQMWQKGDVRLQYVLATRVDAQLGTLYVAPSNPFSPFNDAADAVDGLGFQLGKMIKLDQDIHTQMLVYTQEHGLHESIIAQFLYHVLNQAGEKLQADRPIGEYVTRIRRLVENETKEIVAEELSAAAKTVVLGAQYQDIQSVVNELNRIYQSPTDASLQNRLTALILRWNRAHNSSMYQMPADRLRSPIPEQLRAFSAFVEKHTPKEQVTNTEDFSPIQKNEQVQLLQSLILKSYKTVFEGSDFSPPIVRERLQTIVEDEYRYFYRKSPSADVVSVVTAAVFSQYAQKKAPVEFNPMNYRYPKKALEDHQEYLKEMKRTENVGHAAETWTVGRPLGTADEDKQSYNAPTSYHQALPLDGERNFENMLEEKLGKQDDVVLTDLGFGAGQALLDLSNKKPFSDALASGKLKIRAVGNPNYSKYKFTDPSRNSLLVGPTYDALIGKGVIIDPRDILEVLRTTPSQSVDVITSVLTFYAISYPHWELFKEIDRVLKPGGVAFFNDNPLNISKGGDRLYETDYNASVNALMKSLGISLIYTAKGGVLIKSGNLGQIDSLGLYGPNLIWEVSPQTNTQTPAQQLQENVEKNFAGVLKDVNWKEETLAYPAVQHMVEEEWRREHGDVSPPDTALISSVVSATVQKYTPKPTFNSLFDVPLTAGKLYVDAGHLALVPNLPVKTHIIVDGEAAAIIDISDVTQQKEALLPVLKAQLGLLVFDPSIIERFIQTKDWTSAKEQIDSDLAAIPFIRSQLAAAQAIGVDAALLSKLRNLSSPEAEAKLKAQLATVAKNTSGCTDCEVAKKFIEQGLTKIDALIAAGNVQEALKQVEITEKYFDHVYDEHIIQYGLQAQVAQRRAEIEKRSDGFASAISYAQQAIAATNQPLDPAAPASPDPHEFIEPPYFANPDAHAAFARNMSGRVKWMQNQTRPNTNVQKPSRVANFFQNIGGGNAFAGWAWLSANFIVGVSELMRDASTWSKGTFGVGEGRHIITQGLLGYVDQHIGDVWETFVAMMVVRVLFELPFINILTRRLTSRSKLYASVISSMLFISYLELRSNTANVRDVQDLFGIVVEGVFAVGFWELLRDLVSSGRIARFFKNFGNGISKIINFFLSQSQIHEQNINHLSSILIQLLDKKQTIVFQKIDSFIRNDLEKIVDAAIIPLLLTLLSFLLLKNSIAFIMPTELKQVMEQFRIIQELEKIIK